MGHTHHQRGTSPSDGGGTTCQQEEGYEEDDHHGAGGRHAPAVIGRGGPDGIISEEDANELRQKYLWNN